VVKLSDDEILRLFVTRARRVHAHSLVQDWDGLLARAAGTFEVRLTAGGEHTIVQPLPSNEEIFESLAARLRPFTLDGDPLNHKTIMEALRRQLQDQILDRGQQQFLDDVLARWRTVGNIQHRKPRGYSMQSADPAGNGMGDPVSDTQIAAAWLYVDLVHSRATGPKREALAFPMQDRYVAAVAVFSQLAVVVVASLRLVDILNKAGKLTIADSAWTDEVVVGKTEIVKTGQIYFGSEGTVVPEQWDSPPPGSDWQPATITNWLRQQEHRQVQVTLKNDSGEPVAEYDAVAVAIGDIQEKRAYSQFLIQESIEFSFSTSAERSGQPGGQDNPLIAEDRVVRRPVPDERTQARCDTSAPEHGPRTHHDLHDPARPHARAEASGQIACGGRDAGSRGAVLRGHRRHREDHRPASEFVYRPGQRPCPGAAALRPVDVGGARREGGTKLPAGRDDGGRSPGPGTHRGRDYDRRRSRSADTDHPHVASRAGRNGDRPTPRDRSSRNDLRADSA
jgi:hypothetical protein